MALVIAIGVRETGEELKKEFARRREGMMAAMKKLVAEARNEALNGSEPDANISTQ